ncbi:uncharacterized protein [Rutidosis leptorrhynchoides]|uniref:uncharacterized protein n=1 Tax=Rutidosis leptorrhynchoides TaxID=125765 RepID=UPI003A9A3E3B
MTTDYWAESAFTNDSFVAELLLRIKHSSLSKPLIKTAPIKISTSILPPLWGNRKNRSKSSPSIATGFGKEHRGSPTTHLSWSGGTGSSSDGCDDLSRRSDLDSGSRSVQANEGASTSSFNLNKSHKRKSFIELKDEEGSLLKERTHTKKVSLNDLELTSAKMCVSMNDQVTFSKKLKIIQIDSVDQHRRNQMEKEKSMSRKVVAETESTERGFVLPDLNMTPNDDDLVMLS